MANYEEEVLAEVSSRFSSHGSWLSKVMYLLLLFICI